MDIVLGIIGINILIFVHELGHFLAAKWSGAKVQTFALGFDPTIKGFRLKLLSWKWRETEYVIGLVPFGGYVRPAEDPENELGEFINQPPLKRAIIFAAGAGMNILFGFVAFIIAFSLGVSFQLPEVGSVNPGSPAWEAGIQPKDTIKAVDGENVESFMDIVVATVLDGSEQHTLSIVRDGSPMNVSVTPRVNKNLGMPSIGVSQTLSKEIATVLPDSNAEKQNLKAGDTITSAVFRPGGKEIKLNASLPPFWFVHKLTFFINQHPGETCLLNITSADGQKRQVRIKSKPQPEHTTPRIGIQQSFRTVQYVRPGSEAASKFTPGDVVDKINGTDVLLVRPLSLSEQFPGTGAFTFTKADGGEVTVERDAFFSFCLSNDIVFGPPATTVASVTPDSPAAQAGLQAGDRIIKAGGTPLGARQTLELRLSQAASPTVSVAYVRNGTIQTAQVPTDIEFDKLGISWNEQPVIGRVVADSPAEKTGIQKGDTLVSIDGTPIDTWSDLITMVQKNPEATLSVTVKRAGENKTFSLTPAPYPAGAMGIAFQEARHIHRETNLLKGLGLGYKRTVASINMIFLTILQLVKGEVSASNLQGPVGIIHITSKVTHYGMGTLFFLLALISVNLGVLNLLPIPIFDGGHLLILLIETIKGSRVNEKLLQTVTMVMFFLLIALAMYVTYHDILRIML